jgi:hypothetical protein
MIKAKPRIAIARRALIHRGDSTQTHGQVICPVSFRPTNNTVRRPGKPIPLEEEEEDMVSFRLYEYNIAPLNGDVKG